MPGDNDNCSVRDTYKNQNASVNFPVYFKESYIFIFKSHSFPLTLMHCSLLLDLAEEVQVPSIYEEVIDCIILAIWN